ncbi:MAG TPA: Asp-tRNA(Asn)/Glu-tRNA(Gln) amidotransferase subunit GatA [Solirubrobacteraceae bacterium]|jgi:aspartyl-tRNA(Asn)/glutamyl-tRNA(Gln) amidotransferase subunit A|nr:Asp-tRNA(Asn)/Glu-tRNA(Gln) amidotransferase subunit GatA [Solirubrobacteraceae bacterium]
MLPLSAAQAIAAIEAGELSARELFAFYRERAQADAAANGDGLNCFTWVSEEDQDPTIAGGPLAGVPLAVKDLFCAEGVPSQSGSRILEGYRPPYTATSVARLKDAGATLLAKTNQDEFAMGSSTENSAYGPTLNPWDRTRVPGGSSGGSAAAVAAGLAPWALGTDTGGSIRQPAALCGIVGLKPTYGAVSRYGMIAFASSLDQAGPLTRDVTDAALMFERMVGHDPCDATSLQFPEPIGKPTAERLDGIRLGVPAELRAPAGDFADAEVEPGVRDAFERALKLAEELGASVHEISLPHAPHALSAYYVLAPSEASSNLARFDGVRYGMRAPGATDLLDMYTRTRHDGFGAEVKRRIMLGTYALSSGYYDAYYGSAQRVRTKIAEDFKTAFDSVDLILTPTSANVAFGLGEKTANPWSMYLSDYFTVPMSLAGIPAISIPCGLAVPGQGAGATQSGGERGSSGQPDGGSSRQSLGLPVGLQIAGPAFSENRLLDAAHAFEQALGFAEGAARA